MKNSFSSLDGEMSGLVEYDSQLAMSPVKGNPFDEDNFYPANGLAYGNDMVGEEGGPFDYASGDPYAKFEDLPSFSNADGDYSEARGRRKSRGLLGGRLRDSISGTVLDKEERARRRGRKEARQDERQRRRTERTMSTAEARRIKAGAKATAAEGQRVAAESLGKESQSDVELAKAIAASSPAAEKKGLSTGAKVGIAIGVVAVLGVVGYMLYKRSKNGK